MLSCTDRPPASVAEFSTASRNDLLATTGAGSLAAGSCWAEPSCAETVPMAQTNDPMMAQAPSPQRFVFFIFPLWLPRKA